MNPNKFLDNFSSHLKNVIARAISGAAGLGHREVMPLHILWSLSEESGAVAAEIMFRAKLDNKIAWTGLQALPTERMPKPLPTASGTLTKTLPELNPATKQALERSMLLAYERGHNYVGTEHLLYGILQGNDPGVLELLNYAKVKLDRLREEIESILMSTSHFPDMDDLKESMSELHDMIQEGAIIMPALPPPTPAPTPDQAAPKKKPEHHHHHDSNALAVFTTNLTDPESAGRRDPLIGRGQEVIRLIHVLSRRNKNNPVLVGEPGVGKTAIVEGLAKRIVEGQVPNILRQKKILSLDLTLLIAGTIYRGEFEARLRKIMEEVAADPDIILFIDELHNIIGAGGSAGAMDAANILKPALARGDLRCIGATTIDEYGKHIGSDPALERRFQAVHVPEPTLQETLAILSGIKKNYEDFHHVIISADAVEAAVEMSRRFIHDNFLPDKAIDLLDEAAAAVRTAIPEPMQDKKKRELEQELAISVREKEAAIKEEKFEAALEFKEKESCLRQALASFPAAGISPDAIKHQVNKRHIAEVVSARVHIPVEYLLSNNWDRLRELPRRLAGHIVGQDTVIDDIVETLKRAELRLIEKPSVLSSFLFVGPSGVGKTALAAALARELYQDEHALIRLDMSEFAEAHGVSKILGSPAGYIGYKERNRFTDELRRRPHAVVLFDEFDKAHADVQKLLLQILDAGTLTDSQGKHLSFRHAIIILTTNVGSELYKSAGIGFGGVADENFNASDMKKNLEAKLKETIGTALMSRLEKICFFQTLTADHVQEIVRRTVERMSEELQKTGRMSLEADSSAIAALAAKAHLSDMGVRNVDRMVAGALHDVIMPILARAKRKKKYVLTAASDTYKLI